MRPAFTLSSFPEARINVMSPRSRPKDLRRTSQAGADPANADLAAAFDGTIPRGPELP